MFEHLFSWFFPPSPSIKDGWLWLTHSELLLPPNLVINTIFLENKSDDQDNILSLVNLVGSQ